MVLKAYHGFKLKYGAPVVTGASSTTTGQAGQSGGQAGQAGQAAGQAGQSVPTQARNATPGAPVASRIVATE